MTPAADVVPGGGQLAFAGQPAGVAPGLAAPGFTPSLPLPEYNPDGTPIGGWLIVFALGMGVSLGLAALSVEMLMTLFSSRAYHDLTTEGSPIYISSFSSGVTFEVIWLFTSALTTVILLLRFFRRSSGFPRLAIKLLMANIAFALIDYMLTLNIQSELTAKFGAMLGNGKSPQLVPWYMGLYILYCIVASVAWIIYFRTSRRVESTFIN
jgi:hypothetical protein